MHESKLIRSRLGKDNKYHAVYLVDGTKINIGRDDGLGAWLEIGPTPQVTLSSYSADQPDREESSKSQTKGYMDAIKGSYAPRLSGYPRPFNGMEVKMGFLYYEEMSDNDKEIVKKHWKTLGGMFCECGKPLFSEVACNCKEAVKSGDQVERLNACPCKVKDYAGYCVHCGVAHD